MASRVEVFPGGKGLNQAIAASLAGAETWIAGNIGFDGGFLLETLESAGVNTRLVRAHESLKSGQSFIQNDAKGNNCILFSPEANFENDSEQIEMVFRKVHRRDLLLCQNEIDHMDLILRRAGKKKMKVIYNPAPMMEKVRGYDLDAVSVLIVNESELLSFMDLSPGAIHWKDLLHLFVFNHPHTAIVLTLGSLGTLYSDVETTLYSPAFEVDVVDTTGTRDTFTGYFAQGYASGMEMPEVLRLANAAAALSTTRKGAASSIPSRKEVEKFLTTARQKPSKFDLE